MFWSLSQKKNVPNTACTLTRGGLGLARQGFSAFGRVLPLAFSRQIRPVRR